MDNKKSAEIIQFPTRFIPLKQGGNPITCVLHEKFKSYIDVAETDQLVMIKLNITGEIEITTGDKKYIKEVDFVVDIDASEND